MSKLVKLALIGAGNRGQGVFGQYALDMPHRVKFTAVVEPDQAKREFFAANHQVPEGRCEVSWTEASGTQTQLTIKMANKKSFTVPAYFGVRPLNGRFWNFATLSIMYWRFSGCARNARYCLAASTFADPE